MKRIFAILLASTLLLTACSSGDGNVDSEVSSGALSDMVSEVEEGASDIIEDIMPEESGTETSGSEAETSEPSAQENNGLPSASSVDPVKPPEGSDTAFTQTGNVYKKVSGTNAYFVIAKDFSSVEEGTKRDKAIEEEVKKVIDAEYKEGYYCVAAVVTPDSENSFDLAKERNDFTLQIYKKQSPKSTETGNGESVKKEVTLKNQSLEDYLNSQGK